MTPLLGTKTPSAPVGDKSGGERRAARAAAFQAFTKHETRDPGHGYSLARGASQREFRGFHETRNTSHETRLFFALGAQGWRHRKPPSGPLRPPASHCFPVHRCSPLFGKKYYLEPVFLRRPIAASLGAFARHGAAIARHVRGEWGVSRCPCPVSRSRSALPRASTSGLLPMPRTQYEPMLRKGNVLACISYHVARRSA